MKKVKKWWHFLGCVKLFGQFSHARLSSLICYYFSNLWIFKLSLTLVCCNTLYVPCCENPFLLEANFFWNPCNQFMHIHCSYTVNWNGGRLDMKMLFIPRPGLDIPQTNIINQTKNWGKFIILQKHMQTIQAELFNSSDSTAMHIVC